ATDEEGSQLERLLRVRQGKGPFGFRVKTEKPEKVLAAELVEHRQVTPGVRAGLRRPLKFGGWENGGLEGRPEQEATAAGRRSADAGGDLPGGYGQPRR